MRASDEPIELIIVLIACFVPMLCVLGLRGAFESQRGRKTSAICLGIVALVGVGISMFESEFSRLGYALLIPLCQFFGYFILKLFVFGTLAAKPAFVVFDYGKHAGSWRDRLFLALFLLVSMFGAAILGP